MSTYSSAALTNTRLTRVFNRRNNMAKNVFFSIFLFVFLKTAMVAPSQRISTTVYLHAQFVAPHTSRRVWHFIIAKLRKKESSVFCFFFVFLSQKKVKRQQHGALSQHHRRRIHCEWEGKNQASVSLCLRHSGSLLFSTQTHQRW